MVPVERENSSSLLRRAATVLKTFVDTEGTLSVGEIAQRAGLPSSTTYRLVGELVELGLLERAGRAITLGASIFELAQSGSGRRGLREIALPYIADLREATHQTIHLATLQDTEVVYLEILPAHHGPPLPSRVGGRLPAYATGIGKALLAQCAPETIERVVAGGLRPLGPSTVCDEQVLRRQLRKIRTTNLSYDYEESGPKIVCVASAIIDPSGAAVAAISASGWFGSIDLRRIAPAVLTCAKVIARSVGERGAAEL